jgi:hypothetical protein
MSAEDKPAPLTATPEERVARLASFLPSQSVESFDMERVEFWRNASDEQHGEALRQCLLLADVIGYSFNKEPKPQFPKPKNKAT